MRCTFCPPGAHSARPVSERPLLCQKWHKSGRIPALQMFRFIVKKFSSKSYRLDLRKALKYVKVYVYTMTVNLRQLCFARVLVTAAYLSC